jgi:hypothetical protein
MMLACWANYVACSIVITRRRLPHRPRKRRATQVSAVSCSSHARVLLLHRAARVFLHGCCPTESDSCSSLLLSVQDILAPRSASLCRLAPVSRWLLAVFSPSTFRCHNLLFRRMRLQANARLATGYETRCSARFTRPVTPRRPRFFTLIPEVFVAAFSAVRCRQHERHTKRLSRA